MKDNKKSNASQFKNEFVILNNPPKRIEKIGPISNRKSGEISQEAIFIEEAFFENFQNHRREFSNSSFDQKFHTEKL